MSPCRPVMRDRISIRHSQFSGELGPFPQIQTHRLESSCRIDLRQTSEFRRRLGVTVAKGEVCAFHSPYSIPGQLQKEKVRQCTSRQECHWCDLQAVTKSEQAAEINKRFNRIA